MSRVLVTGGAGTIGAAVVRRLLSDPAYEVRVSDQRPAPQWMREGAEVHTGDLRSPEQARQAAGGCTHVIHLAAIVGGIANFHRLPHTLTEVNNALYNAVIRAALEAEVERFVYVSSSMVFERAELFPTPEDYLPKLPGPALGLRILQAHRRGLLPGRARRARPAVHDLPPLQRLWPGRGARRRAWHRARGAGPDQQGARGTATARDLRLGRADADPHARRGHCRRGGHGDELACRAERGLQHLSLA